MFNECILEIGKAAALYHLANKQYDAAISWCDYMIALGSNKNSAAR